MKIINIKQCINDIFGKNAEDYWSNEGNNKRMRFYCNLNRGLRVIKFLLKLFIALYLIGIASESLISIIERNGYQSLLEVFDNPNNPSISNSITNMYLISFVLMIGYYVLDYKINSRTKMELINSVTKSIFLLPVIVLVLFHFKLNGSLMSTFWIAIVIILLSAGITVLNTKIYKLYAVSVGKPERRLQNQTAIKTKRKKFSLL